MEEGKKGGRGGGKERGRKKGREMHASGCIGTPE